MPTRAVKLKLIIPRSATAEAALRRQALWRTHHEVNAATAYYEQNLLLLRGRHYQTADETVRESDAPGKLIAHARFVQTQNLARADAAVPPTASLGTDDEIVSVLTGLYAAIVPSVTGDDGGAQAANAHLSPLTDPASKGFMDAGRKLDRPLPNWRALLDSDPDAALEAANSWFASPASAEWRSDTGSPATWLRKARAGDRTWPQLFSKKLVELQAQTRDGLPGLFQTLRSRHLLPLFSPYFEGRIAGTDAAVTPWDRLAFRLAVAHLLSWESWSRRAADEHARRNAILTKFRAENLTESVTADIERLRSFERERNAHLSTLGLGQSEYRLTRRQLRNWPELRERWTRTGSTDPCALMEICKAEQARLRGRFGDPAVFEWLAAPTNQHVWRSDPDAVSMLASLNGMEALVARSRETAMMTFPDAVAHPRAVQWSAVGDNNLRPYRLSVDEQGECTAKLRLLVPCEQGDRLLDQEHTLKLASSKQFKAPVLSMRGAKAAVTFSAAGVDTFSGVLGSADLLFDRPYLARRHPDALAAGDIGPAWLKLSLDLDPIPPEGWNKDAPRFINHFRKAGGKATGHEATVSSGNRVLSVDLGVATFAACSVFSLCDSRPADERFALTIDVGGRSFWAVHERSFHLTLPDEIADRAGLAWRREQDERLRRLRRALSRYRRMLRFTELDGGARAQGLIDLQAALTNGDPFAFEAGLLDGLQDQLGTADPIWKGRVEAVLAAFQTEMGSVIKAWRRDGRARAVDRRSGQSMWAIQHLSDIRRLLLGWSLMGRHSGHVRRQGRFARGIFASKLLEHIDALKENRLKSGADMLVQAARGYLRDKAGRWRHAHPPCDVVLFEHLSRYRMLSDRPRRENTQLMIWAHRVMRVEVEMQGEMYGLGVADTEAAFSSRYHARSNTPGIRCRALTKFDLSDAYLRERLAADNVAIDTLEPGVLVPWDGGEVLVCPRAGGGVWRIDADINAAQNLQRRFWTRHGQAFRIPCLVGVTHGQQVYIPRSFGQRLLGAMGGYGVLDGIGGGSPACRWRLMRPAEIRKLGLSHRVPPAVGDGSDDEEMQGLAAEAMQLSGKFEVFFRDPSGVALPSDRWYPQKVFWSVIKTQVKRALSKMRSPTIVSVSA